MSLQGACPGCAGWEVAFLCVCVCSWVCRHPSPSPSTALSAPRPVLAQVLSPFVCSGTNQAPSAQANLFPSFLPLPIWLSVCSGARVQLSVPIITEMPCLAHTLHCLWTQQLCISPSLPHTHTFTHTHTHPGSSSVAYSVAIGNLRKK